MPIQTSLQSFKLFSAAAGLVLGLTLCVQAGGYRCHCEPSLEVYSSPFYGYYRTCWRPWPGGQPLCPSYATVPAAEPTPPAGTSERTIELLPPPRPEEPEDKGAV